jgi:hypothetical protein
MTTTTEQTTTAPGQATPPSKAKGYLEEDNGNKSSMRLMSFTALIAAIIFGTLTVLGVGGGQEGIFITFGFLLAAFAPKALQKFAEAKVSPISK